MGKETGARERRILSIWFPRLAAERAARRDRIPAGTPVAVVASAGTTQTVASVTAAAEAAGLHAGQFVRDAYAICPGLVARPASTAADDDFLSGLCRVAEKFSPLAAKDGESGLILDVTGCAHLFGGEESLLIRAESDFSAFGLTAQAGIADTVGAAWALARFACRRAGASRSGDDIDQEARATRSRAAKRRRWQPELPDGRPAIEPDPKGRIAPSGGSRASIAALPIAALRLPEGVAAEAARLGLREIQDIMDMPRAPLARRFGDGVLRRLDQALGFEAEPVSPEPRMPQFACRLSFPDPIGLPEDIQAGVDKLLPELCSRLERNGRAARRVRLTVHRADSQRQVLDVGLAQAADSVGRIRPILKVKLGEVDPGFGIDMLRLEACDIEMAGQFRHSGGLGAAGKATPRPAESPELRDLIGRIGARIGLEAITRHCPADSHIPEKTYSVMAAAWSEPAPEWPEPRNMRPVILFDPEIVHAPDRRTPPAKFRWRRRDYIRKSAVGPERIMPEWWLDDPNWRSGTRDYWRVVTQCGQSLWLFYAYGSPLCSSGWFCQGDFG